MIETGFTAFVACSSVYDDHYLIPLRGIGSSHVLDF